MRLDIDSKDGRTWPHTSFICYQAAGLVTKLFTSLFARTKALMKKISHWNYFLLRICRLLEVGWTMSPLSDSLYLNSGLCIAHQFLPFKNDCIENVKISCSPQERTCTSISRTFGIDLITVFKEKSWAYHIK